MNGSICLWLRHCTIFVCLFILTGCRFLSNNMLTSGLQYLAHMTTLQNLYLRSNQFTGTLAFLRTLTNLHSLYVVRSNISLILAVPSAEIKLVAKFLLTLAICIFLIHSLCQTTTLQAHFHRRWQTCYLCQRCLYRITCWLVHYRIYHGCMLLICRIWYFDMWSAKMPVSKATHSNALFQQILIVTAVLHVISVLRGIDYCLVLLFRWLVLDTRLWANNASYALPDRSVMVPHHVLHVRQERTHLLLVNLNAVFVLWEHFQQALAVSRALSLPSLFYLCWLLWLLLVLSFTNAACQNGSTRHSVIGWNLCAYVPLSTCIDRHELTLLYRRVCKLAIFWKQCNCCKRSQSINVYEKSLNPTYRSESDSILWRFYAVWPWYRS